VRSVPGMGVPIWGGATRGSLGRSATSRCGSLGSAEVIPAPALAPEGICNAIGGSGPKGSN
jgi:hypothetical protein